MTYHFTFHRMEKTPNAPVWTLYQRDDCHLCDLALEEMARVRFPEFESVFIDDDELLEMQWGDKVPVLQHNANGQTLVWPFDANSLRNFLEVHAG